MSWHERDTWIVVVPKRKRNFEQGFFLRHVTKSNVFNLYLQSNTFICFFFLVLKWTQQLIIYSEEAAMEKPINKQQKPNPNGVYHLEQTTQINYAQ